ncbi:hypothetical protein [uncultured Polaribacter sp.]|uniref:fibronectin type III domain-containing protein n=1 Tax=uncultured Polaribacter sp. TaxID=174711 RepID=UPI00262CF051|nr:hypothetical protein [uncultured Polaribacter sp.]
MKKHTYIYLVFALLLVYSCGNDEEPENMAPSIPTKIFPLSNTLCVDNAINFQWNAAQDPEGDALTYRIQIADNSNFQSVIENVTVSNGTARIITLEKGLSFFWRIKAIDANNAESEYSEVSQFLTEGDPERNHLPFIPELISPSMDSEISGTNTILRWSASDADEDPLTYDVYLDTNIDPTTKVSDNQTSTIYEATNLVANTTYYFKILVKDNNGGTTVGQVWSFSTN